MSFHFKGGRQYVESVPLTDIAERVGTPAYVYSEAVMRERYAELDGALSETPHRLCYAVKANSNLSVLSLFAELGAGFDIVSGGELQRVVSAGGDPHKVVFSGVGKSVADMDFALKHEVGCFNVESEAELARLAERARLLGKTANVAVRVNPDVDAQTHPYISTGLKENKFGVPADIAHSMYHTIAADPHLVAHGIACHIGSQISSVEPFAAALDNLLQLIDTLAGEGITLEHVDVGGGLGISYHNEPRINTTEYGTTLCGRLSGRDLQLVVEPGRFLVGDAGVLLTRVEYLKPQPTPEHRNFAVVDAAMNDLIRPALYQAWHPVTRTTPAGDDADARAWDVVGPVCESGDFLATERPLELSAGDLLAVGAAGAYGMALSSNYNSRSRPAEVLVKGDSYRVVRRRETLRDQIALELDACQGAELT